MKISPSKKSDLKKSGLRDPFLHLRISWGITTWCSSWAFLCCRYFAGSGTQSPKKWYLRSRLKNVRLEEKEWDSEITIIWLFVFVMTFWFNFGVKWQTDWTSLDMDGLEWCHRHWGRCKIKSFTTRRGPRHPTCMVQDCGESPQNVGSE